VVDRRGARGREPDPERAEEQRIPRRQAGTARNMPTMAVKTISATTRGLPSS
jgi:hypothetical protein